MITTYLQEVGQIAKHLNIEEIGKVLSILVPLKNRGRLFILGVGGSAANSSHCVNDFRKICGIEAYAPTDNISELTARTNDDGWDSVFVNWLMVSKLTKDDVVMILSVGGGSEKVSANLVDAINFAKFDVDAKVIGIVSRDGGYTKKMADACIMIPIIDEDRITPHAEAFQAVLWHLLVWELK